MTERKIKSTKPKTFEYFSAYKLIKIYTPENEVSQNYSIAVANLSEGFNIKTFNPEEAFTYTPVSYGIKPVNIEPILTAKELKNWLIDFEAKLLESSMQGSDIYKYLVESYKTVYKVDISVSPEVAKKKAQKEKVAKINDELSTLDLSDNILIDDKDNLPLETLITYYLAGESVDFKELIKRIKKEATVSFFEFCKKNIQVLMITRLFNMAKDETQDNKIDFKELETEYNHLKEIIDTLNNLKKTNPSFKGGIPNYLSALLFILEARQRKESGESLIKLDEYLNSHVSLNLKYWEIKKASLIEIINNKLVSWKNDYPLYTAELDSFYLQNLDKPNAEFYEAFKIKFVEVLLEANKLEKEDNMKILLEQDPNISFESFETGWQNKMIEIFDIEEIKNILPLFEITQRLTKIYIDDLFDLETFLSVKKIIKKSKDNDLNIAWEAYKVNLRLYKLDEKEVIKDINKILIGQEFAVDKIGTILNNIQNTGKQVGKPMAIMLFLGPTGVGKSELAKIVAKKIFGSEDSLIQIPLSQYQGMEAGSISNQLAGSQKGYVGSEDGGDLTNKMKENPNRVVLFDELDKINPSAMDVFMQLLDEGKIYSNKDGDYIDFSNSIVIFTTNFGAKTALNPEFDDMPIRDKENKIREEIIDNRFMKPEFMNRFKDVLLFNRITVDNGKKILINLLKSKASLITSKSGKIVEITNAFYEYLFKEGYSVDNGVRYMKKVVEGTIDELMKQNFGEKMKLRFDLDKEGKPTILVS